MEKKKQFQVFITEIHNPSYDSTNEYDNFNDVLEQFNATYDVSCKTKKELDDFIAFYNENISEDEISYSEFNDLQSYLAYCEEIGWKPIYEKVYDVWATLMFDGKVSVIANSLEEAQQIVRNTIGGNLQVLHDRTDDKVVDWDFSAREDEVHIIEC